MRAVLLLVLATVTSCSTGNEDDAIGHRYVNEQDGFALYYPDGWSHAVESGAVRFAPSSPSSKATIIVRAAQKPSEIVEGRAAANEEIFATVKKALRQLPAVSLSGPVKVTTAKLAGARFSLTFVPVGLGLATRYQRAHVTLVGKQRLFHITFTAPQSEPFDESAFQQFVSTLEEET